MHKRNFVNAAAMVQQYRRDNPKDQQSADLLENTFVKFFLADNNRFDEWRFREACK